MVSNPVHRELEGVWLTDVSPVEASQFQRGDLGEFVFRNYADSRVEYWIRVDVTYLEIHMNPRPFFVIPEDRIPLNRSGKPYGTPYVGRFHYYKIGNIYLGDEPFLHGKTVFAN